MKLLMDAKFIVFPPKISVHIVFDKSTVRDGVFIVSPDQKLPNEAFMLISLRKLR